MKDVLFRKIADTEVQDLISRILDSGAGVLDSERVAMWFEGDGLLEPATRPCGLPIGNLTSQFFANVLLNELDQFVHHHVKPRLYVRYMDDFLLFDRDRDKLTEARAAVSERLAALRLRLHEKKTAVRSAAQGVRFLGFKLTPVTRRICPENISRFRTRMRRLGVRMRTGELGMDRITASVRGWLAHAEHANSTALVKEVLADVRV